MIGVYVFNGPLTGQRGFLFAVDGRTAEVVTRREILRVDMSFIRPLDTANSFDAIDDLVEALVTSQATTN